MSEMVDDNRGNSPLRSELRVDISRQLRLNSMDIFLEFPRCERPVISELIKPDRNNRKDVVCKK
jgi:hypothetical protein